MRKRNVLVGLTVVAILCDASLVFAGPTLASQSLSAGDKAFLRQTSFGNLLQMQMEGVVMRKTRSARDRAFARRQAITRSKAEERLQSFAAGLGVAVGDSPTAAEQRVIDHLSGTPRYRFDAVYRQVEVRRLAIEVEQTRQEAESGHRKSVKAYAKKLLLSLAEQLRAARALSAADRG